jgi:hypothetical protein
MTRRRVLAYRDNNDHAVKGDNIQGDIFGQTTKRHGDKSRGRISEPRRFAATLREFARHQ